MHETHPNLFKYGGYIGEFMADQGLTLYGRLINDSEVGRTVTSFDSADRQRTLESMYESKRLNFIEFLDRSADIAPFDVVYLSNEALQKSSEGDNYFSTETRESCFICTSPMAVRIKSVPCNHITCWSCFKTLRDMARETRSTHSCSFCRATVTGHAYASDDDPCLIHSSDDDDDYEAFPDVSSGNGEPFRQTSNSDSDFVDPHGDGTQ